MLNESAESPEVSEVETLLGNINNMIAAQLAQNGKLDPALLEDLKNLEARVKGSLVVGENPLKSYLLDLLDSEGICPPYPGVIKNWEKVREDYKKAINESGKTKEDIRQIAQNLLVDLGRMSGMYFSTTDTKSGRVKLKDLAEQIQGGEGKSDQLKNAAAKFRKNRDEINDFPAKAKRDEASVKALDQNKLIIDEVAFICVGYHAFEPTGNANEVNFKWSADFVNSELKGVIAYTVMQDHISKKTTKIVNENVEEDKDMHIRGSINAKLARRLRFGSWERRESETDDLIDLHLILFKMVGRPGLEEGWKAVEHSLKESLQIEKHVEVIDRPRDDVDLLKKRGQIGLDKFGGKPNPARILGIGNFSIEVPEYRHRETGRLIRKMIVRDLR